MRALEKYLVGKWGNGLKTKTKTKKVSYTEAYKKADKTKYPTLESFTKAAKEYNIKNPKKKTKKLDTDPGFGRIPKKFL